ncbi:MAG: sigma-70 family RNA polymerase sigma factor [Clostridium sp.]|nr:sigma-70 family RNA polymerase sigma factor [Clostridium sp.]
MRDKKASIGFIEKCYKLYEQKMYQIAYSILRDSGLAEDAVQEAFIKLMKSGTSFENPKSEDCKRYIITVIKHSAINIYNKKRREREIMYFSDEEAGVKDLPDVHDEEEAQELQELISVLPSKYYAVVDCLAVKELSVKETAKTLGITEANVRKRFERAKLMLKTIVKGRESYGSDVGLYKAGNF